MRPLIVLAQPALACLVGYLSRARFLGVLGLAGEVSGVSFTLSLLSAGSSAASVPPPPPGPPPPPPPGFMQSRAALEDLEPISGKWVGTETFTYGNHLDIHPASLSIAVYGNMPAALLILYPDYPQPNDIVVFRGTPQGKMSAISLAAPSLTAAPVNKTEGGWHWHTAQWTFPDVPFATSDCSFDLLRVGQDELKFTRSCPSGYTNIRSVYDLKRTPLTQPISR